MILLFTSKTCPKCAEVKKKLGNRHFKEYSIDTVDGHAEAAYYDILSVPTVLFIGDVEEARFIGVLPDGWEQYVSN